MRKTLLPLLILLLLRAPGWAQEIAGSDPPETLHLEDGTVLHGRTVEETPAEIIFDSESLGIIRIPRERIVEKEEIITEYGVDPDVNSIMFCPTPETLPRGTGYFRSFELFFLNVGFAPTDDINLSFGTLFPVTGDFYLFSMGTKWRLLDRREHPIGLAVTGQYSLFDDYWIGGAGIVAGVGNHKRSLNLAVNRIVDEDGDTKNTYMVGADFQGMGRSKLLLEFFSNSPLIGDFDDDLIGFINVGIRVFGDDYSFSLTGFRPLWEDDDGGSRLFAWPMVVFSKHF